MSRDLGSEALPVATLAHALPHLRRPFTPEAVKFKVQAVWPKGNEPTGCFVVTYIDARLVIERLNAVCAGEWHAAPEFIVGSKLMWCHLNLFGTVRSDVGESSKGISKDLWSDALKRAGVQFGVGVSLYALRQITLNFPDAKGRVERRNGPRNQQGQPTKTLALTEAGTLWLREGYAKWLDAAGIEAFGPVLDHGDVVNAGGVEDLDVPEAESDERVALTDAKAADLVAQITGAYTALKQAKPRAMTEADFKLRLDRVRHDYALMEGFRDSLRAQANGSESKAKKAA